MRFFRFSACVLSWILPIAIVAFEGGSSSEIEDYWLLQEPTTLYDPALNTFTLQYTLNDDISISDNVRTGITDMNCGGPVLSEPEDGIITNIVSTDAKHSFQIDMKALSENPNTFIGNGPTDNRIKFCTRFMLWTGPENDPTAFEVNFFETIITLTYDLTANFATTVSLMDPALSRAPATLIDREDYTVNSYACDPETKEPINVVAINPGMLFSLCMEMSEAALRDGLILKGLVSFTWTKPDGASEMTEVVVENGVWKSVTSTQECTSDGTFCVLSSLIIAKFYSSSGIVTGNGQILHDLVRRRSLEKRILQGTNGPSNFEGAPVMINLEVTPVDTSPTLLITSGVAHSSRMAVASAIGSCISIFFSIVFAA